MGNSWLTSRRFFTSLDRFDAVVWGTIAFLVLALGVVVLRGDQIGNRAQPATIPRITYLGPIRALVANLYAVPITGGTPQKLTNSKNGIIDYDIAPNGQIVYAEILPAGPSNLMVYDPVTNQSRLLFECKDASCIQPAWRPDGKMVAFDRSELNTGTNLPPGAPRVWLYDLTTNQARRLFDDSQKLGYMARWSRDGSKIAVWDSDRGGIVLYDFTTRTESVVPAFGGRVGEFSPDGTKIWISRIIQVPSVRDPSRTLYVTHISIADISKFPYRIRDLIPDSSADDDTDPIWSADGQYLYLLRRVAGASPEVERQIYQVNISTGEGTQLVGDTSYTHSNLSLHPDGTQLVFQRLKLGAANSTFEIWVYHLQNKTLVKVAENGNVPRWLP
jgi:Tol biopolymer transport system component